MNLEKHLVLNNYFIDKLGFADQKSLYDALNSHQQKYNLNGISLYATLLLQKNNNTNIRKYDKNIKEYVDKLRKNRNQPAFDLKYFQYLSILFTEMFLDEYFNNKSAFVEDLNKYLKDFNKINNTKIDSFKDDDIKKLAYWIATGGGKTLIMHINYWQYLKYNNKDINNILLITPNEGMSIQHANELKLSGIPYILYNGNIDINSNRKKNSILIIDINKLTSEKKGQGVSVDISYFEDKNLVFIDEGHKGSSSENETGWKSLREEIAKNGFIFEYSATFGQIIEFDKKGLPNSDIDKNLYNEYTKSIIFNYSYKYFYFDGYGKDFNVFNIKNVQTFNNYTQSLILTANLLSYFEQLLAYEDNTNVKNYNIEKPLWIFVGSKVSGKGINSDVYNIILFIKDILNDQNKFLNLITNILNGSSGLINNNEYKIISDKYKSDYQSLQDDIYDKIFEGRGELKLVKIKNADGEIGLKISNNQQYFGVINVGDVNELEKLFKDNDPTLVSDSQDLITNSLFLTINNPQSHINILIGSKKFIEGWNSWRVSSMALMNIGKSEGSQIIQLFGRGVRFKGENLSLKRENNPDKNLKVLQTLYIFGLNANYISYFLNTISKEDVSFEQINIPLSFNHYDKWNNKLYILKSQNSNFLNENINLKNYDYILKNVTIDVRTKISSTKSTNAQVISSSSLYTTSTDVVIPDKYLKLIDWQYIYLEIINFKISKDYYNLSISLDVLKAIINSKKYKIFIDESSDIVIDKNEIKLKTMQGLNKLHELIIMILQSYITKFYVSQEKKYETNKLEALKIDINDCKDYFPENYEIILKINNPNNTNINSAINRLKNQLKNYCPINGAIPSEWYKFNNQYFDNEIIHFDNHLYTPLIIWKQNKDYIQSIPVKLNEGETKFINDLKNYIDNNKNKLKDYNIFLLRNLSRRGIGFFTNIGFYPDFIMWITDDKNNLQYMTFIDPKGIRYMGNFNDEKIKFCYHDIYDLDTHINTNLNSNDKLYLNSFIISNSKFSDIQSSFGNGNYSVGDFMLHHILFQENDGYIQKLFCGILRKNKVYQLYYNLSKKVYKRTALPKMFCLKNFI